jgi:probable F420-dependent oxidoreductase
MAHGRRFRFGVQTSTAASGDEWAALARQAEDLGYATMFLPDHFGDQLAPVPAMPRRPRPQRSCASAPSSSTTTTSTPWCWPRRWPRSTVLSGGRVELGLGAGWMISDYEQSGIPYDEPAVRVDRFEEGLAVIKGLLGPGPSPSRAPTTGSPAMDGLPKPVQQPGPPMLIGGGLKRMLTIAGREADIVGINPTMPNGAADADAARSGTADETDQKLAVGEGCRRRPLRRPGDQPVELRVLRHRRSPGPRSSSSRRCSASPPEELLEFPHALVGTIEQICEADRGQRRERWDASYIVVQVDAMEAMAPVVARPGRDLTQPGWRCRPGPNRPLPSTPRATSRSTTPLGARRRPSRPSPGWGPARSSAACTPWATRPRHHPPCSPGCPTRCAWFHSIR